MFQKQNQNYAVLKIFVSIYDTNESKFEQARIKKRIIQEKMFSYIYQFTKFINND